MLLDFYVLVSSLLFGLLFMLGSVSASLSCLFMRGIVLSFPARCCYFLLYPFLVFSWCVLVFVSVFCFRLSVVRCVDP